MKFARFSCASCADLIQRKESLPVVAYFSAMTQVVHARPQTVLCGIEPFSAISDKALKKVTARCTWQEFPANTLLIDGDCDEPHGVFLITEGIVELSRRNARGEAVPIGRFGAPSCFGEFAAIMNSPGTTTVRTVTCCRATEVPEEAFVTLVNENPSILLGLLKKAISIVRALDEDIVRFQLVDNVLEAAHRKAVMRSL